MGEIIEPIIIDTSAYKEEIGDRDQYRQAHGIGDIYEVRERMACASQRLFPVEVTILVVGYNRLEKTKRCVDSILKYTSEIPYELYLIDNGSDDGTFEYFCSVPYESKVVMRFTQNIPFVFSYISIMDLGRYVVNMADDLIVTENWLSNLLTCANSDSRIGIVQPLSSNVSNLQDPGLSYSSYDEMQAKAACFNRSDPRKWEERLRIITLGYLIKKEVLMGFRWPLQDFAFSYFGDDDMSFMVRRLGYKVMLAGDTWICHDHVQSGVQEAVLTENRLKFRQKHHGIDAWDDVNNYWKMYLSSAKPVQTDGRARILGIDVKCGTPVLDLKNWLRSHGAGEIEASAAAREEKYYADLLTCCDGTVVVERAEKLRLCFDPGAFDYIIADQPVNGYADPQAFVKTVLKLLKPGGSVFLKLKSTFSIYEFLYMTLLQPLERKEHFISLSLDELQRMVSGEGTFRVLFSSLYPLSDSSRTFLRQLLRSVRGKQKENDAFTRLQTDEWILQVTKKAGRE